MVEQFNRALTLAGTRIVDSVASFLPGALVFLGMLLGGLVVAVVLRSALRRGLHRLDFDRRAESLGIAVGPWT